MFVTNSQHRIQLILPQFDIAVLAKTNC